VTNVSQATLVGSFRFHPGVTFTEKCGSRTKFDEEEDYEAYLLDTRFSALCPSPDRGGGTKQSATINISEPVVIAGTHLQPGEYTVRWTGTGSDAQAQFLQGKREILSVPVKVVAQNNPISPAVTMRPAEAGLKTISAIDLSKLTLQFPEKTESAQK
jgi:hypothetical protein